MTDRRIIHPKGYIGLEIGSTVVVLGAMGGRIPLMSTDELHWLVNELIKVSAERLSREPGSEDR